MTKELGLKVSAGKIRIKKIRKTNVPVLAKKKDGEYLLILNHNNQKWMILDPIKGTPESIDEESIFYLLGAILLNILVRQSRQSGLSRATIPETRAIRNVMPRKALYMSRHMVSLYA